MIVLKVKPGLRAARSLAAIKSLAQEHPGEEELTIAVGDEGRLLTLGEPWRYDGSPACLEALGEFGEAAVEAS